MWITGILDRATAWRGKALASGVAARRIEDITNDATNCSNAVRSIQMLPRDSVVRGSRPATPQPSGEADSHAGFERIASNVPHDDQQAASVDDSYRRGIATTTWRYEESCSVAANQTSCDCKMEESACAMEFSRDCDAVETVEFHSEDSNDDETALSRSDHVPSSCFEPELTRNLADMLSSDEEDNDYIPGVQQKDRNAFLPTSPISSPPVSPRFLRK